MGDGHLLRIRKRSEDARALKAQLDLIAESIRSARYVTPVWGLALAFIASDRFGYVGRQPWRVAALLPAVLAIVCVVSTWLVAAYRRRTAGHVVLRDLQTWYSRFVLIQFGFSMAWSLMPWLLWTPGEDLNHVFLSGCMSGVLAGMVISRANNMAVMLAGLVPLAFAGTLRFLLGGDATDMVLAAFIPAVAFQFFSDGRRLTYRIDQDTRLRFEVEDLARELEEARDEALRKRFEAETANASKTAFLANMSHELRTPLNAILGFSEIIAKECFGAVGSPRYREYATDIHASGAHLLSLINDLLDVAKIEAGRMEILPQVLDVRKIFETALKIIAVKARERCQELAVDIDPAAPQLFADERALKQILINLVSNAVKFTPEGGRIAVVASRARCGSFQIMVEDNGPGIPREKLDKIFKPFSQVDNRYDRQGGGTGLGLSLVRGLAELHGGRAWIESEQGKGCRAFVVFPVTAAAKSAVA